MIIVSGNKGQLGYDIEQYCLSNGIQCRGIDIEDLDITDETSVIQFFNENKMNAFIHCAAYTAVDKAEENPELCYKVNTSGTENLVNACKVHDVKFMFFSTDYVFDGSKEGFYSPDDERNPLSVYGKSKALAEKYIEDNLSNYFIVRISWAFGLNGNNFIKTMLRLAQTKTHLDIVSDQFGSPTYTKDVVPLVMNILKSEKYGRYHATNEGYCSWAEFAEYIFSKAGAPVTVGRILTKDYPTPAKRPLNSRLDRSKLTQSGFNLLPTWQSAVDRYLKELEELN
jgi:dTDP-4-dehydrorhamnose reductase